MKTINVVAAIIKKDTKIFATARGYGEFKGRWEFPGGKIEANEDPKTALLREIKEELDIDINIHEHFIDISYTYPNFHLNMQCFICSLKDKEPILLEHEQALWLDASNLDSVNWLEADKPIVEKLKQYLH